MDISSLHYLADSLNEVEVTDYNVKDVYTSNLNYILFTSTEGLGDMVVDFIKALIRLISGIIHLLVTAIKKVFNKISRLLSDTNRNIESIKRVDKKKTDELLKSTVPQHGIPYKTYVEYLYVIIKIIKAFNSTINILDMEREVSTIADLKPDDDGAYLKPTKYVVTEALISSLKDDLNKIGLKIEPVHSTISNQDIVYTECNISYVFDISQLYKDNTTLSDLGYTVDNILQTNKSSYSTFTSLVDNASIYIKSLEKIKGDLTKLQSKAPYMNNVSMDSNNKIMRVKLLIANLGVTISLYSKISILSTDYINWFQQLTNIVKNISN